MKLVELKKWVGELPEKFEEYSVVFRTYGNFEGTEFEYMLDKPIIAAHVDEEHKELCLLDEQSYKEFERIEDENNISNIE